MISGTQHLLCLGQFGIVYAENINESLMLGRRQNHIEIITYIFVIVLIRKFLLSGSNHAIEVAHPFKTFRIRLTSFFADDLTHGFEVFLKTWIGFYGDIVHNLSRRVINQLLFQINDGHILKQTVITGHQSDLFFLLFSCSGQPPHPQPHKQEHDDYNGNYDAIFMLFPERGRHHIKD